MSILPAALSALLLAYCFSATGDLLLNRRSVNWLAWNQSFLAGLSLTATLFFPVSLLLRRHALLFSLIALLAMGAFQMRGLIGALRQRSGREGSSAPPLEWQDWIWLSILAWCFLLFTVQNFRMSYAWDGYQIWATKALVIFQEGALGSKWIGPGEHARLLEYPAIVPLYEALVVKLLGRFEWNLLKPVFPFFYLSMLTSTYQAATGLMPRRVALGAVALLASLPAVSTRFNVGGYADMPQAALVAGLAAALLSGGTATAGGARSPIPWLIGGVILVKNEGLILSAVVCATILAYWVLAPGQGLVAELRRHRQALLVVLVCFLLRLALLRWLNYHDQTYGPLDAPHLLLAYQNLLTVPKLCLQQALQVVEWGVFWVAFLASALLLALTGRATERALVAAASTAILLYVSIFYFTNWELALHIEQAFNRLMVQVAPLAAVAIGAAYWRIRRVPAQPR